MEIIKLLLPCFISVAAIVISGISLYISIINRKNALREHLYKEQLTFFIQLSEMISDIEYLFDDVSFEKTLSEEKDKQIEERIDKLYRYEAKYDMLIPNEKIDNAISEVIIKAYDMHTMLANKKGVVEWKDFEPFNDAYGNLIDEIREFTGVEALSKENQDLYMRQIKNETAEARKSLSNR